MLAKPNYRASLQFCRSEHQLFGRDNQRSARTISTANLYRTVSEESGGRLLVEICQVTKLKKHPNFRKTLVHLESTLFPQWH